MIKLVEEDQAIAGGALLLPETAKEKPQQGIVLAAGLGRRDNNGGRIELDVKKNDRILFAKYAGIEVKLNGEKFVIMKETEILGIIKD